MEYTPELVESLEETLDNTVTEMILHLSFDSLESKELFDLYNALSDKLQDLAAQRYPEYRFKNFQ